ncbi:unnamed protein product [Triticum turgidum subsp. durum]|uniref:Protein kinase domain-containing protein n=1 Tax=Triticum turgidum subsp. durum TaxID=4567 RepID=A0A9R1BL02_TRITD|nr:unnamed protein product [Triticum turgidum subsp. durum]
MTFPLKQLVPCLCGILILLLIMFFSRAKAQPCRSTDSNQDRLRGNYTIAGVGSEFYLIDKKSRGFGNLSDSDGNNTQVLSIVDQSIRLWQLRPDGGDGLEVDGASFSATVAYQPLSSRDSLAFLILPSMLNTSLLMMELMARDDGPLVLTGAGSPEATSRSAAVSGSTVSIRIGVLSNLSITEHYYDDIMVVDITIDRVANKYTVWIDYDSAGRSLSVYADVQANPKPDNIIAEVSLNITNFNPYVRFGLLSTAEQLHNARPRWNATVEQLLPYPYIDIGGGLSRKVTILSSVLGSVATTAVMAVGLACYFNSRYRRWHKDLDQLARSMERLPGVPTKVEFADIKKATGNFHEAMKLGGGGFGTVYRCTLTASASKTERPMDVAVKRFTRDVQNRCYDDFLAEVSIINRLRHKNIVPFVVIPNETGSQYGWSYNKGEPLLVFEFMTNGSLDQHLFPKVSNGTGLQQAQRTGTAIRQWATRYGIVRDIATGLHYVHHEYEPMVLHRDIKASNVMLDSSYRARLGDFGLACTVDVGRNSATGVGGTWGYIAPEYAMCGKATRQTDICALGVLILEVVTGQRALIRQTVDEGDAQITDRVWRLHRERRLMECVDAVLIAGSSPDEDPQHAGGDAERLLLLGLACSSPNPSDRPSMPEVVQVIAKSAPPPEVPLMKPIFMWPPPEGAAWGADDSTGTWMMNNLDGSITSTERQSQSLTAVSHRRATGGHASFQLEP